MTLLGASLFVLALIALRWIASRDGFEGLVEELGLNEGPEEPQQQRRASISPASKAGLGVEPEVAARPQPGRPISLPGLAAARKKKGGPERPPRESASAER